MHTWRDALNETAKVFFSLCIPRLLLSVKTLLNPSKNPTQTLVSSTSQALACELCLPLCPLQEPLSSPQFDLISVCLTLPDNMNAPLAMPSTAQKWLQSLFPHGMQAECEVDPQLADLIQRKGSPSVMNSSWRGSLLCCWVQAGWWGRPPAGWSSQKVASPF